MNKVALAFQTYRLSQLIVTCVKSDTEWPACNACVTNLRRRLITGRNLRISGEHIRAIITNAWKLSHAPAARHVSAALMAVRSCMQMWRV